MAVESAADRAVFLSSDDFGVTLSWTVGATTVQLNGLAATGALQVDGMDSPGVVVGEAAVKVRSADLPAGAGEGDAVTLDGVPHRARALLPDGTGMTLVRLEQVES